MKFNYSNLKQLYRAIKVDLSTLRSRLSEHFKCPRMYRYMFITFPETRKVMTENNQNSKKVTTITVRRARPDWPPEHPDYNYHYGDAEDLMKSDKPEMVVVSLGAHRKSLQENPRPLKQIRQKGAKRPPNPYILITFTTYNGPGAA